MSNEKTDGTQANVAKMYRPDPSKPAAEPPRCCGECGGEKKNDTKEANKENKP